MAYLEVERKWPADGSRVVIVRGRVVEVIILMLLRNDLAQRPAAVG